MRKIREIDTIKEAPPRITKKCVRQKRIWIRNAKKRWKLYIKYGQRGTNKKAKRRVIDKDNIKYIKYKQINITVFSDRAHRSALLLSGPDIQRQSGRQKCSKGDRRSKKRKKGKVRSEEDRLWRTEIIVRREEDMFMYKKVTK